MEDMELSFTEEALAVLKYLKRRDVRKFEKVQRALAKLAEDPRRPGLHSHRYQGLVGPGGADAWQSYVENRTPGAWRIWWSYGPETGEITILGIGPHPD